MSDEMFVMEEKVMYAAEDPSCDCKCKIYCDAHTALATCLPTKN